MSVFKKKAKDTKAKASKAPVAKKPNTEIAKSEKQVVDKLEILIENSKNLKMSNIAKQPTDSTPDVLEEIDQGKTPIEAAVQTSEDVITEAAETISQEKAILETKKLSLEGEFPEVLVTTGRQRDTTTVMVKHLPQSSRSNLDRELDSNLTIASTPWAYKLLQFQTSVWDSKHGEHEQLMTSHTQELIQLYVDIALANNIVWLSTELGHRSKELDESYIKLCKGIAERIINIR